MCPLEQEVGSTAEAVAETTLRSTIGNRLAACGFMLATKKDAQCLEPSPSATSEEMPQRSAYSTAWEATLAHGGPVQAWIGSPKSDVL